MLFVNSVLCLKGASLLVAIQSVKKGAAQEGMTIRDYIWRGHDPTSVAVMTEVLVYYSLISFLNILRNREKECC